MLPEHPDARLDALAALLRGYRFTFSNEKELQSGLAEVLQKNAVGFSREHRLSSEDIVDFLVDGELALEVKVAGGRVAVLRQLLRYAEQDDVRAVLLVTTRHHHDLPQRLADKPVRVLTVGGALG